MGGRKGGGRRGAIDPKDLALWKTVTGGVKPLAGKHRKPEPVAPAAEAPKEPAPPRRSGRLPRPQPVPVVARQTPPPPLGDAAPAGLDRRTAQRLARGQLPIDASLDLHGMTQAAAARALEAFLSAAVARGERCLLIVTGKGSGGEGSGVLRRQLPAWLEASAHRRDILALAPARAQHGGGGAFYLLLRRRREGPPSGGRRG